MSYLLELEGSRKGFMGLWCQGDVWFEGGLVMDVMDVRAMCYALPVSSRHCGEVCIALTATTANGLARIIVEA